MPRKFATHIELVGNAANPLNPVSKQQCDTAIAGRAPLVHTHPEALAGPYPMTAYGIVAASYHIDATNSIANTVTVNTIEIYRMYVPPGLPITKEKVS